MSSTAVAWVDLADFEVDFEEAVLTSMQYCADRTRAVGMGAGPRRALLTSRPYRKQCRQSGPENAIPVGGTHAHRRPQLRFTGAIRAKAR